MHPRLKNRATPPPPPQGGEGRERTGRAGTDEDVSTRTAGTPFEPQTGIPKRVDGMQPKTDGKLEQVAELLPALILSEFTGYIKINFSQGGISRIEKFEEISSRRKLKK
jgi:hypothetical protein